MSSARGNLFVVSGFSGSGKGTIMEWFKRQDNYALSISCTSRTPRVGEQDGVQYYFISHDEFLKRASEGYFLEHAIYVDKGYGTPAGFVEENLQAGRDVLLEIEMQGAMQVREKYPNTTLIFITPPSVAELRRRLTGRNTETPEQIEKRLSRAAEEGRYMDQYDYIVVNDDLDTCIHTLDGLMQSMRTPGAKDAYHHLLVSENQELIRQMKQELQILKK